MATRHQRRGGRSSVMRDLPMLESPSAAAGTARSHPPTASCCTSQPNDGPPADGPSPRLVAAPAPSGPGASADSGSTWSGPANAGSRNRSRLSLATGAMSSADQDQVEDEPAGPPVAIAEGMDLREGRRGHARRRTGGCHGGESPPALRRAGSAPAARHPRRPRRRDGGSRAPRPGGGMAPRVRPSASSACTSLRMRVLPSIAVEWCVSSNQVPRQMSAAASGPGSPPIRRSSAMPSSTAW